MGFLRMHDDLLAKIAELEVQIEEIRQRPAAGSYQLAGQRFSEIRRLEAAVQDLTFELGDLRPDMVRTVPWHGSREQACIGCGARDGLLAPGLISWVQSETDPIPPEVVALSAHGSRLEGGLVTCAECVPMCALCLSPRPSPAVLEAIAQLVSTARDAEVFWYVEPCACGPVAEYLATVLHDDHGTVFAGPDAGPLDPPFPNYVITGWNPAGALGTAEANDAANIRLEADLRHRGLRPQVVIGQSEDGAWRETSFLVAGLDREAAVAIGAEFGQIAIFELQQELLTVLSCSTGLELGRTDRRR